MSDRFQTDAPGPPLPEVVGRCSPLPTWLADRLLRPDEEITWVRGPRFNPSWERYVTHPALFLLALVIGAVIVGETWLIIGESSEVMVLSILAAGALPLGSIFVLGIANGYFTRLVVTNFRLVILQGYEVCRGWGIDDLPHRLIHYGMPGGRGEKPSIDLEAVKTMLGGSSDKITGSKAILSFGKQLDQIKTREDDRS
jgi:hypothetical protein